MLHVLHVLEDAVDLTGGVRELSVLIRVRAILPSPGFTILVDLGDRAVKRNDGVLVGDLEQR